MNFTGPFVVVFLLSYVIYYQVFAKENADEIWKNFLLNLTSDNITEGSINKYIVNGAYTGNMVLSGGIVTIDELAVINLTVTGTQETTSTQTSVASNIEIITQNAIGPALRIQQNDTTNTIISTSNIEGSVFKILNDGKVGINTENPTEKLDVNGNIKFSGSINNISHNVFSYLSDVTSPIEENFTNTSNYINIVYEEFETFKIEINDYVRVYSQDFHPPQHPEFRIGSLANVFGVLRPFEVRRNLNS